MAHEGGGGGGFTECSGLHYTCGIVLHCTGEGNEKGKKGKGKGAEQRGLFVTVRRGASQAISSVVAF